MRLWAQNTKTAEIPADLLEPAAKKCAQQMLEELATIDESNEDFMMKVLENPDAITEDEIHAVIRKGVCANQIQSCSLRYRLQEQRGTAASRRDRQLDALAARPRY